MQDRKKSQRHIGTTLLHDEYQRICTPPPQSVTNIWITTRFFLYIKPSSKTGMSFHLPRAPLHQSCPHVCMSYSYLQGTHLNQIGILPIWGVGYRGIQINHRVNQTKAKDIRYQAASNLSLNLLL